MKRARAQRERERERRPPRSYCTPSPVLILRHLHLSLFAVILLLLLARLFIRGSPLRPLPPFILLHLRLLLLSHGHTARSFFPAFIFLRRTFWRAATKDRPTDRPNERASDRPRRAALWKILRRPGRFSIITRRQGTQAPERGSGGNLGLGYELCAALVCVCARTSSERE